MLFSFESGITFPLYCFDTDLCLVEFREGDFEDFAIEPLIIEEALYWFDCLKRQLELIEIPVDRLAHNKNEERLSRFRRTIAQLFSRGAQQTFWFSINADSDEKFFMDLLHKSADKYLRKDRPMDLSTDQIIQILLKI